MKLFSFFAFNQLSAVQLRSSLAAAERCEPESWLDDENVACSNGLESGSLCLRFCTNRNERSKVIQCRCYGEDCSWQGAKPDCFRVDQPANLFSTKSTTTTTTTTTTTIKPTTTARTTAEQPSTLQFTTVLLSKEERKAIKKAKKVANRKKARQEAKKFNHVLINHLSTSSSTTAKALPLPQTRTLTTTAAPTNANRYDPEAPIRIPSQISNPMARQNRMNPALLAPRPPQTSTTTTEEATTTESETATEGMSLYTDRYDKHLVNKEKRIRQRLHDQLLEKKKKFDIQSRSRSKFQQDSFGFEDYEAEEDPVMFLESETLENFIADTDRVLNMTISTESVCPEQTNPMIKCSYDNTEGSICVRKDCKNSSVSSCNCVNGLCGWSVGEPICQTWGSGCFDGICESCDKVDWQSDENFICSHLNYHGSKCYRSDCSKDTTSGFTTISECLCAGNYCEWTKKPSCKKLFAL